MELPEKVKKLIRKFFHFTPPPYFWEIYFFIWSLSLAQLSPCLSDNSFDNTKFVPSVNETSSKLGRCQ